MSRTNRIALLVALFCGAAAQVSAAPSAGLLTGGNTIAGPAAVGLASNAVQIVFTDDAGNSDACTTVSNIGRGAVRLGVTGDGSSTIDVAAGQTAALCRNSVSEVSLTCLSVSPATCAAQWRVDRD